MTVEWSLVIALLAIALVPVARQLPSRAWAAGLVVAVLGTLGAARAYQVRLDDRAASAAALMAHTPPEDRHDEFTTSDACRACHPSEYASWHHSYHRSMTQYPSPTSVLGDFDGTHLEVLGEQVDLEVRDDGFYATLIDPALPDDAPARTEGARITTRISLVTGSHHMQAYWVPATDGNRQSMFPFMWLNEDQRWVPRESVFINPPSRRSRHQVWNTNCVKCHTSYGVSGHDAATGRSDSRVAEMGIACESCHGPAQAHVAKHRNPAARYARHLVGDGAPDDTIVHPGKVDHRKASEACGFCHAIRQTTDRGTVNAEGYAFRPGDDIEATDPLVEHDLTDVHLPHLKNKKQIMEGSFWRDGMVRVSGREFSAMQDSACYQRGELGCGSCHAMHDYVDRDHQLAPGKDGDAACTGCHPSVGGPAHTHHAAGTTGSACYDCHMPYTSYGLMQAMRSHEISSPSARETAATGRPNACNTCHVDRTLAWTAAKLGEWYGHPVEPLPPAHQYAAMGPLNALMGDAGQRALAAWHLGWGPAQEASGTDWQAPLLAELLDDPYAPVRYIAHRSLTTLPGYADFTYDFVSPEGSLRRAQDEATARWTVPAGPPRPHVLLDPGGYNRAAFEHLRKLRNDRPVVLNE